MTAEARGARAGDPEALDLFTQGVAVTILRADGLERVLIADGVRHIRLELRGDSLAEGPVRLRYDLEGFSGLDDRLWTLRRLSALRRTGRLPKALFPVDRIAQRWAHALQAWDGHRAGAAQRDVAAAVLGPAIMRDTFGSSTRFEALRKRVARLIDKAEQRSEAGRRRFLQG